MRKRGDIVALGTYLDRSAWGGLSPYLCLSRVVLKSWSVWRNVSDVDVTINLTLKHDEFCQFLQKLILRTIQKKMIVNNDQN